MKSLKTTIKNKPKLTSTFLWIIAIIVTLLCFTYQDKTGPTYPVEGVYQTSVGEVQYKFLRSETIGTDLTILFLDPVPEGVTGTVKYRRVNSDDDWTTLQFEPFSVETSRHGKTEKLTGLGVQLPSLHERAGKYEYFVYIQDGDSEAVSISGEKPIYARYKGAVPGWVIVIHVLTIFASMAIAIRTVLEALIDGNFKWMIWATIISLLVGGFIFGPLVQWYAFGVWWSGVPFGFDWTDNKVLFELAFWLIALYMNRGERRNRASVYVAGVATLLVYFIPHSLFGSEYNYKTGTGRGTSG